MKAAVFSGHGVRHSGWTKPAWAAGAMVLAFTVSLVVQVAVVPGAPASSGVKPAHSSRPAQGSGHVELTGTDYALAPFTDAEFWGGGSPVERCLTCEADQVLHEPQGQSTSSGQAVNADTGNFTTSNTLFDVPTVGADMGVTLTYNSQLAQTEVQSGQTTGYGLPNLGIGWTSNDFPSLSASSTVNGESVTVNEENGAEITFTQASNSATPCDSTGISTAADFTGPSSSMYFCAPDRVDAQLDYYDGYYYLFEDSDQRILAFDSYFTVGSVDTWSETWADNPEVNTLNYYTDESPGTYDCPSGATSCDVIGDIAGRYTVYAMNGSGQVYDILDPSGASYGLSYQGPNLTSISTPSGPWNYSYTAGDPSPYSSDLTSITDPDNHETQVGYGGTGLAQTLTDAANNQTSYQYQNAICGPCNGGGVPNAQNTTVSYPDGETDVDHYVAGLLTGTSFGSSSPTNPYYDAVTYNYQIPNIDDPYVPQTLTVVHADSSNPWYSKTITTDYLGRVLTYTSVNEDTTTNVYNTANNYDEVCYSAGPGVPSGSCASPPHGSTIYTYDAHGNETSVTDPLGNTTHYGYNSYGQLCWSARPSVTIPSGASCTSPPTGATVYGYDSYGNLVSRTVASGTSSAQTATASYDVDDRMTSSVPPDGNVSGANQATYETTYAYNDAGRLQTVTAPGSRQTSYTYDADGNVLTETDPSGATTATYDVLGRHCWEYRGSSTVSGATCGTVPSGATSFSYFSSTSAPATVTDPDGNATSYSYTDPRFPTSPTTIDDPMKAAVVHDLYDADGNLCVSGPFGPPGTSCVQVGGDNYYQHDANDNLTLSVDASNYQTSYTYGDSDYPNLATKMTAPMAGAAYNYDADGHLLTRTDTAGNAVSWGYNTDGQQCWQAPGAETNSCSSPPTGTGASTFSYDQNGLRSQMVDNNGTSQQATSTYSYDANGSQTSVTDDNGTTIGYQYDPEGDLTCIAYPVVSGSTCTNAPSSTNTVIDRGFNSAGELTSVRDWLGNTTGYGYNPEGNVTSIQYPSSTGEGLSYGYDANQNLKSTTFTGTALQANESWTPNSDELTSSTSQLNGYSSNFSYNDLNAVTQAKNPGASGPDAYQYYSNGQLESDTPPGGSAISYNYNSAEELTSLANPNAGATTSFAYTADGQRCWSAPSSVQNPSCSSPPAGATSYAWSTLGTLCWEAPSSSTNGCGSPPSGSTTFSYNGDGIRSSETAPSGTVSKFTWDTAQATTPELLDDGSNAYVYGPLLFGGAAPVEQISLASGEASFLASVPSGVQAVFTQSGVLQDEASYSTYGSQSDTTTSASPFGFAGGYRDASGLVYLVHRYYDPATGQFMNVDPLDPITGQPYEYAGDNPINASDPLGLDCRNTDTCPSSTSYGATEGSNPTPSPSSYGTPGPTGACGCGLAPTIYSVASNTQQALSSYMCGGGNACAPPSANQSLSEAEPDIACECTGDVGIIGSLATVNTPSLGATATGFALGTCLLGDVPGCLLAQGIALVARSADRRNEPLACQEIQDAFDTSITGIGLGLVAAPFWIAESASPVVSRAGAAVPDISQTALGSPHPSC